MSENEGIITEIMAEKTFNLGNYESLKAGARVSIPICGSVEKAEAKLVEEIERLKQKILGEKEKEISQSRGSAWATTKDKHGFETYHESGGKE